MNPDLDWAIWSGERKARVEGVLARVLPRAEGPAAELARAMRYAVEGGGKRIRPLLAYAAGEAVGAGPEPIDAGAAAVELIHAYSLVHDDLPCMDDDTLRRGKPTCHVAFGEATALLAGDALQSLAFAVLADAPRYEIARCADPGRACAWLAEASGVAGMAGGQAIDLASTGVALAASALETMHAMKTGALIRAAVRLGAGAAADPGGRELAALDAYAAAAGLAFQVVDDLLDAEASTDALGKTAGKDLAQRKATFVAAIGVGAARARANELREAAHAALAPLGGRARRLAELADWIVRRDR